MSADDVRYMRAALALGRRGLGGTWPNPSVGCVIVNDGRIVGRGWTQPGGRPHGEAEALARAGEAAGGATVYVGLEPCSHWGRTPPCADALVDASVSRVVIAIEDPDPRVSGQGIARLREAGIAVEVGLCALEAREINAGFLIRMRDGRPLVTLKLASTLDGRIATAHGDSQWITGAPARDRGHLLRASHDAIMVGSNTVLRDNPHLTCRLPGLAAASPVRLVVDRALRVPLTARLVAEAQTIPTWFIIRQGADEARCEAFEGAGVKLIEVRPTATGEIDLAAAFRELGKLGLTRVLVEGGAMLAAALLRADLVDRLAWFRAPILIGGDGLGSVAPFGIDSLAAAPRFVRASVEEIGDDVLETLQRAP